MRLNINLATQPYEDARQFWMRWGTGLGVAALLTLVLLTITVSGWFAARRDQVTIASYRAEIAQRDQTRRQAEDYLNQPQNRATRDESQFINQLIERKSLSWTLVLEDLEKVMPARVHLISIRPELSEDNQLTLKLVVGGDSRERAIELARRMEESRRFTQTYIQTERTAAAATGDAVEFDINGTYVPNTMPLVPLKTASTTGKTATPTSAPDGKTATDPVKTASPVKTVSSKRRTP
jgi:type IV pilus assembly protein PilN